MTKTDTAPLSARLRDPSDAIKHGYPYTPDALYTEAADALDALSARLTEWEIAADEGIGDCMIGVPITPDWLREQRREQDAAAKAQAARIADLEEKLKAALSASQAREEQMREALTLLLDGADCSDYGETGTDHPDPITHRPGEICPVCVGRAALSPAQPAQDRRILAPWNPCLEKLKDGEPFFVLLGRDKHAAAAVRCWADQREAERGVSGKTTEARQLADQMDAYRGDGASPQPAQGADIARELAEALDENWPFLAVWAQKYGHDACGGKMHKGHAEMLARVHSVMVKAHDAGLIRENTTTRLPVLIAEAGYDLADLLTAPAAGLLTTETAQDRQFVRVEDDGSVVSGTRIEPGMTAEQVNAAADVAMALPVTVPLSSSSDVLTRKLALSLYETWTFALMWAVGQAHDRGSKMHRVHAAILARTHDAMTDAFAAGYLLGDATSRVPGLLAEHGYDLTDLLQESASGGRVQMEATDA